MSEHWRYLKILDDDIQQISRFIEPSASNLSSYSLELARLLMIATQECDVLLKAVCRNLGDTSSNSESAYRQTLMGNMPSVAATKIAIEPFSLQFSPFEDWISDKTPDWWTANNKIKHERIAYFERANLGNVLKAISGAFVANLYFHRDDKNHAEVVFPLQHFSPVLEVRAANTIMQRTYAVPD